MLIDDNRPFLFAIPYIIAFWTRNSDDRIDISIFSNVDMLLIRVVQLFSNKTIKSQSFHCGAHFIKLLSGQLNQTTSLQELS